MLVLTRDFEFQKRRKKGRKYIALSLRMNKWRIDVCLLKLMDCCIFTHNRREVNIKICDNVCILVYRYSC